MSVASVIHHAKPCPLLYCHLLMNFFSTVFFHIISNGTIFGKQIIEQKMCVLILSTSLVWKISYSKRIQRDTGWFSR